MKTPKPTKTPENENEFKADQTLIDVSKKKFAAFWDEERPRLMVYAGRAQYEYVWLSAVRSITNTLLYGNEEERRSVLGNALVNPKPEETPEIEG